MGFTAILARVANWWKHRKMYAATVRELSQLSDRELHDLGIARCDIEFVARGATI